MSVEELKEEKEEKVDYLDVDGIVAGQQYCCLSFVEPVVDKLAHKESFIFHKFLGQYSHILYLQFCKLHKIDPTDKLQLDLEDLYERYGDFKAMKYEELCKEYVTEHGDAPHMRMVKVRGSYPSAEIANEKAKGLRLMDANFDVFVGQVGYWIPFNPININDVEPEYIEEGMQSLVKTHLEQERKKEQVFNERKDKMTKQIQEDNAKPSAVQLLEDGDELNIRKKRRRIQKLPNKVLTKLRQKLKDQQTIEDIPDKEIDQILEDFEKEEKKESDE